MATITLPDPQGIFAEDLKESLLRSNLRVGEVLVPNREACGDCPLLSAIQKEGQRRHLTAR
ncbi:hypothetical protein ABIB85_008468 [Bradyrhizobium sp. JR1.5]